jgi:hypothetical protein
MSVTVVSYVLIVAVAWIALLALVVFVGRQVARARERRDAAARAAAWVERRGGEDRRVVFDRRSGLTDRRMGLPDDRPQPLERRRGPPDRRGGRDRRSGADRRTAPAVA